MINVSNVNEAPYDISLSNLLVEEEGSVGQLVGQLSALDPDSAQVCLTAGYIVVYSP